MIIYQGLTILRVFFRKNETKKRNHKKWQLKKVVKFNGQTDRQIAGRDVIKKLS